MVVDLTRLINNYIEEIAIKQSLKFESSFIQNTEIKEISDIGVDGFIRCTTEDLYDFNVTITGEMVLLCSITLEDVIYPLNIQINEILTINDTVDEKYIKIINNRLDIMPIIWQNIVMEIPLKVIGPNAYKARNEGTGWRLITDEERNREMVSQDY